MKSKVTGNKGMDRSVRRDEVVMSAMNARKLLFAAMNSTSTLPSLRLSAAGAGQMYDGRRDIDEICGYKTTLSYADYYETYDRMDVASRIVETYPDYTWLQNPDVYENEEAKKTKFETDWDAHVKTVRPFAELRNLDILAGIGRYGLLVIGVDDGGQMETPLKPLKAGADPSHRRQVLYMRAYTEGEVEILEWDNSRTSPRYGLPIMYKVTPGSNSTSARVVGDRQNEKFKQSVSEGPDANPFKVHYTRCIHFADNAFNSTVYGIPRLRRVFNRMHDVIKIVAGSAEMYWRGAYQGFAFEGDAEAELTDDMKDDMKVQIDRFIQGLDRKLLLQGVETKPLSPAIASPKDHIDVQLTMIAIASRIPKRIFSGSEMGKLASVQDAENWATQVATRRVNVAEPRILRPYVNFCIVNGVVRAPVGGKDEYVVNWQKLQLPTDQEQSETSLNFTKALAVFVDTRLFYAIDFENYLVNVWNLPTEKARVMAAGFDLKKFEEMAKEMMKSKQAATRPGGEGKPRTQKGGTGAAEDEE